MSKLICADCQWRGDESEACEVQRPWERFEHGDTYTPFECPDCGALAFYADADAQAREQAQRAESERFVAMRNAVAGAAQGEIAVDVDRVFWGEMARAMHAKNAPPKRWRDRICYRHAFWGAAKLLAAIPVFGLTISAVTGLFGEPFYSGAEIVGLAWDAWTALALLLCSAAIHTEPRQRD